MISGEPSATVPRVFRQSVDTLATAVTVNEWSDLRSLTSIQHRGQYHAPLDHDGKMPDETRRAERSKQTYRPRILGPGARTLAAAGRLGATGKFGYNAASLTERWMSGLSHHPGKVAQG